MKRSYFNDNYYTESFFHDSIEMRIKIKEVLHSEDSPFQKIDVIDTKAVGKLLLLDGKTMVSDLDEFVYHESITHIPINVHPNPKKVLIIGGGDCGAVREFCRHPHLEEIHLVEIDERVIEVSKQFFPECTSTINDPRVKINPTDGIEFIKNQKNQFDVIIIDSTDPEDFAEGLFHQEFYQSVYEALTSDGIMVAQTENPFFDQYDIPKIYSNLKAVFPVLESFNAPISIYPGTFWTFAFASKKYLPTKISESNMSRFSAIANDLKWYNIDWHKGVFSNSNFVKKKMDLK